MRDRFTLGLAVVQLSLHLGTISCSDAKAPKESKAREPGEPGEADAAPAQAVNELLFASDDFTLQPGEEKYMCWAHDLPADRPAIIRSIAGDYGRATHHVFFAWTLAPEPDGMSECPVLFKTTWIPIYLGGKGTSPLEMPEGAAIDLGVGKQLVLQLHLQNTGDSPVTTHSTMHLKLGDPAETYTPAGIFGLDDRVISIPPGASEVETRMNCTPGKDMNVFAALGHMHKMGRQLTLSKNGEVVYDEAWNFDEQPITPLYMTVGKTDSLGLVCRHTNSLDRTVSYGESSDDEMCAAVFYYTPYDQLGGCLNLPPAVP